MKKKLTPSNLVHKSTKSVEIKSKYDWNKQRLAIKDCKFGTWFNTTYPYQTYNFFTGLWFSDAGFDTNPD